MTLEFVTPSGMTSLCECATADEDGIDGDDYDEVDGGNVNNTIQPYSPRCRTAYGCATSDVNDVPHTEYTTDMYLGLFYVTPARQLLNHFTMPLFPPTTGTLTMVGTATRVRDIEELVQQQKAGKQKPACVIENTAYRSFLQKSYPSIQMVDVQSYNHKLTEALRDGTCDVIIVDHPVATQFVLERAQTNDCFVNGMVRS